jgi:hypothetical protein
MSAKEAKIAIAKIISFLKAFDIDDFLFKNSSAIDWVASHEPAFGIFLRHEFPELIETPTKFGIDPDPIGFSQEILGLKEHVPFAKFRRTNLLSEALSRHNESSRKAIFTGLRDGFAALGLQGVGAAVGFVLGRRFRLEPDQLEATRSEIRAREKEIDEGTYEGVEEQQATLGDVDITRFDR